MLCQFSSASRRPSPGATSSRRPLYNQSTYCDPWRPSTLAFWSTPSPHNWVLRSLKAEATLCIFIPWFSSPHLGLCFAQLIENIHCCVVVTCECNMSERGMRYMGKTDVCLQGCVLAGSPWAWWPHDWCRHLAILVARVEILANGMCTTACWAARWWNYKVHWLQAILSLWPQFQQATTKINRPKGKLEERMKRKG